MSGAQNQHYVPKFILRNFLGNVEKEQVHVFKKSTGKGFTTSIANIMAERRFHEFRVDDQYYATFEESICHIEDIILPIYTKVLENEALDGSPEEKATLLAFLAFQFTRTQAQRDLFDSLEDQFSEKLAEMGASLENIQGYAPRTDQSRKLQHINFIKNFTEKIMGYLVDKDLMLLKASPGRYFYLSDHPVCLHNDEPRRSFLSNLGFSCKGIQVYLPLSAELMLCAWCPTIMDELRRKNAEDRRLLSGAMLSSKMIGTKQSQNFQKALQDIRALRKPIEDRIKHCDSGTPAPLGAENMDFLNSMQIANAIEHVVCKQADFSLAKQFMAENPNHRGLQPSIR